MGRVLALDYGEKRVGWAVSDSQNLIVQDMNTIQYTKPEELLQELKDLITDYEVEKVVVGYPKNMDGTIGEQARAVDAFIDKLNEQYNLPVTRWDERLTSVMAEQINQDYKKKVRQDKTRIDSLSASIILNEFLSAQH